MPDPPPDLSPEDRPDEAELGRLALSLLRELAQSDPRVAEKLVRLGIASDAETPLHGSAPPGLVP
jgi:hypothetical protein